MSTATSAVVKNYIEIRIHAVCFVALLAAHVGHDVTQLNGFSDHLFSVCVPEGRTLGLPASQLFSSTPPSPSCACRALPSTLPSPLLGEEKIKWVNPTWWPSSADRRYKLSYWNQFVPYKFRNTSKYLTYLTLTWRRASELKQLTHLVETALAPSAGWRATLHTGWPAPETFWGGRARHPSASPHRSAAPAETPPENWPVGWKRQQGEWRYLVEIKIKRGWLRTGSKDNYCIWGCMTCTK